jgi:hypothetical protein
MKPQKTLLELLTYLQESSFGGFGFDFRDRVGLEEVDGRPERVSENVEKFEENARSQSLLLSVDLWKTWIKIFWIRAKNQKYKLKAFLWWDRGWDIRINVKTVLT